jgi:uncharacterized protein YgbK (DUF1537 family)
MAEKKTGSPNNSPLRDGGIVVIADDLTGAAELAGISLRYGLTVELCVGEVDYKNADVLVVSTDSRSLNKEQAIAVTEKIVKRILLLEPTWIYKKIDSVLRGHVVDEVKVQMRLMNRSKAFIMPGNPSLGRTISEGEYFVNGVKISEAGFEHDPEFPIKTSSVKEILNNEVKVIAKGEQVPGGIVAGEVVQFEDYEYWLNKIDDETVLVGAGDFFTALLNKYYKSRQQKEFKMQLPHLYVSGTAFKERKEFIKKLKCVSWLPAVLDKEWVNRTGDIVKKQKKAIIAIDEPNEPALSLRIRMAKAVKEIVEREEIKEILIEGGSTAAAILEELNIKRLEPTNELSRGVVRMKSYSPPLESLSRFIGRLGEVSLFITVKPGSYELPEPLKRLYS